MKRYIKPNTEVVLMQSEPVMAPISGGGGDTFHATLQNENAQTGVVLGKESEISTPSLWDEEE